MIKIIKNNLQRLIDKWIFFFYKKNIIINNNPYKWCTVPVLNNYPKQSQTHPSIIFFRNEWMNATHWLGTTPYPGGQVQYENPCIYYANSHNNAPTVFTPISSNPILEWPKGNKYNSDIDVFFHDSKLYALSREYDDFTKEKKIFIQQSSDGKKWSNPNLLYYTNNHNEELLSPSIISYKDKLRVYFLNGDAGIKRRGVCTGVSFIEGTSLENPNFKSKALGKFINKEIVKIEPWHCDLFEYKSDLYMIFCGRDLKKKTLRYPMETYLAISKDYENFHIFDKPLVKHIKTYRPSAYIDNDMLHLYFSVVGDILGDNVDRRIGVTSFNFNKLLKSLI